MYYFSSLQKPPFKLTARIPSAFIASSMTCSRNSGKTELWFERIRSSQGFFTDITDYFDRAPRGVALETLHKFGVPTETPFSSFLRFFWVVVTGTVDKSSPLAHSPEMAIESIRIRTSQQFLMLMPILFPVDLVATERPYNSLATIWTAFANSKHNISLTIDGGAFTPMPQAPSSHALWTVTTPVTSIALIQLNNRRPGRPNISPAHSHRDPPFLSTMASGPSMTVVTRLCVL